MLGPCRERAAGRALWAACPLALLVLAGGPLSGVGRWQRGAAGRSVLAPTLRRPPPRRMTAAAGASSVGLADIGAAGGPLAASSAAEVWTVRVQSAIKKSREIRGGNYVQIATVDADGAPRCRTVVFRGFQSLEGTPVQAMRMITDARSEKVGHVQRSPACELVWWFPASSEQYRVAGELQLVGPDASGELQGARQGAVGLWLTLRGKFRPASRGDGKGSWGGTGKGSSWGDRGGGKGSGGYGKGSNDSRKVALSKFVPSRGGGDWGRHQRQQQQSQLKDAKSNREADYFWEKQGQLARSGPPRSRSGWQEEKELFDNTAHTAGIDFDKYDGIAVDISGRGAEEIPPIDWFDDLWEQYELPDYLWENISRCKYKRPTPIQRYAIPVGLSGRDAMCCAQTGSGKTCAFLVPILSCIDPSQATGAIGVEVGEAAAPKAVVLAPTRELCSQIFLEARKLSFKSTVRVSEVYGG
ncbi:unnamed protein product [Prorocentrum cordatum]|uniref:Pyridoxal 5'-phosphate synthase n=1 Tax=Prorocentrum cordatum TaxID=2364126 RepID=A0ABN9USL7_9DINO|nr:unnamed protein product [Polarella glacialis]